MTDALPSNLVARLRQHAQGDWFTITDENETAAEAADEIERLRAALKKAKPIVGAACASAGATGSNDSRRLREKVYTEICEALGSTVETGAVHPDPTGKTREPPHCPTCGCGLK